MIPAFYSTVLTIFLGALLADRLQQQLNLVPVVNGGDVCIGQRVFIEVIL